MEKLPRESGNIFAIVYGKAIEFFRRLKDERFWKVFLIERRNILLDLLYSFILVSVIAMILSLLFLNGKLLGFAVFFTGGILATETFMVISLLKKGLK